MLGLQGGAREMWPRQLGHLGSYTVTGNDLTLSRPVWRVWKGEPGGASQMGPRWHLGCGSVGCTESRVARRRLGQMPFLFLSPKGSRICKAQLGRLTTAAFDMKLEGESTSYASSALLPGNLGL